MARASQTKSKPTDDAPHLTEIQHRVLRLISLGCTIKKTAAILGRSPSTIDGHKTLAGSRMDGLETAKLGRGV